MCFTGTGKTVVGAYIVYWFSLLNSYKPQNLKELKDKEKKEVILYCGPSNKSVDVVAGKYYFEKFRELRDFSVYLSVYARLCVQNTCSGLGTS